MIRRVEQENWLLITQVEHAHIAGELAFAWGGLENVSPLPMKRHLLPAIRSHDEGWSTWDDTPSLHPKLKAPRSFTEMPMAVSTLLWRESILFCSGLRKENAVASIRQFQRFLTRSGRRLTTQRAFVIEEIFAMVEPFDVEMLAQKLGEHPQGQTLGKPTLLRLLGLLEAAEMLKKIKRSHGQTLYHPPGVERLAAPFGGMWVSQFFCNLAKRARDHREDENDLQAIETFLNEQQEFQQLLLKTIYDNQTETLKQFDREGVVDWKTEGLQWLQFFDRLSLWLCCQHESKTFHIETPDGTKLHLTPLPSHEIAIDPFPFEGDKLHLSTSAKSIPKRKYLSEEELHNTITSAPLKELDWSLVKW